MLFCFFLFFLLLDFVLELDIVLFEHVINKGIFTNKNKKKMSFVILKTSILFHFYNLGIIVNGYYVIDKTYELLYSLYMVTH